MEKNTLTIERAEERHEELIAELNYLLYKKKGLELILGEITSSKTYKFFQQLKLFFQGLKENTGKKKIKTGDIAPDVLSNRTLYEKTKDIKLPYVTVISVNYKKEREIRYYLEAFMRQDYRGAFEIIIVDDVSPDSSLEIIQQYQKMLKQKQRQISLDTIKIIRNRRNLGNCASRNLAIKKSRGEIIVILDSDCVVNKGYITSIVTAHLYDDCDVAIGHLNIETNDKKPLSALEYYEALPEKVLEDSAPQDSINKRSFLNCITRNFSIKKRFITEDLFDPLFGYSKSPRSGFGWEDIEMGYRLYKRGARIKFVNEAFSIHISHPTVGILDKEKPYRSLLNFKRLYEKHPELLLIARRWTLDTYQKILHWMENYKLVENEDKKKLDHVFKRFLPPPFYIGSSRKIRILTYKWHSSHQYELYKLPYEFHLVTHIDTGHTNQWDYGRRPLPQNAKFVHVDEVESSQYDLAILHFDENVLAPHNTNGVIGRDWGSSFKWFVKNVDIPKVAICHGTPQFSGQYDYKHERPDLVIKINEKSKEQLVDFVGDMLVVTNSHQARKEWGFKNSKTIWHGFDPSEFLPSTYQKGILTLGKMMQERPHYRGYYLYKEVVGSNNKLNAESLSVPEPHELYDRNSNSYAFAKFQNYVDAIRQYSIYFNPTLRSPMPRSRGEAMMCGLAMVTTKNHDVEMFIKHGWNGFYSNNPDELHEYLMHLLKNPEEAKKIGMRGRMTAIDIFNHDRYLQAWEDTITDLIK